MSSRAGRIGVTIVDILIHEAGHVVTAWELGVPIESVVVSRHDRLGDTYFASDIDTEHDTADQRTVAERTMLVHHAGFLAQRRFHYDGTQQTHPISDYLAVLRIAARLERDEALINTWSAYIANRARTMIEQPATWARIRALAIELARRSGADGVTEIDGAAIDAFLTNLRVPRTDPFLAYRRRLPTGDLILHECHHARRDLSRAIGRAYVRRGRRA